MKPNHLLLYPISLLYGLVMLVRNLLFNLRILPSRTFDIPVITIGNLAMGGTGKTPMTEYLIGLLQHSYKISVLSRGYKRSSKGFLIVSKCTNVKYSGDEPLQLAKKFDSVKVALDVKRNRGIQLLIKKYPDLDVVLLDDAFQHRYVKPGLSILLTNYYQPYTEDYIFPAGTLRESSHGASRADIIVVTKTPKIFSPISRRRILEDIKPLPHQHVYFSFIHYGEPVPLFSNQECLKFPDRLTNILLVTGIANDSSLVEHLERICSNLLPIRFRDHHLYTLKDIRMITARFNDLPTKKKVIVTTEKDIMRLKTPELSTFVKSLPIFYIPIETAFHGNDKAEFENDILLYVTKNKRYQGISGKQNEPEARDWNNPGDGSWQTGQ